MSQRIYNDTKVTVEFEETPSRQQLNSGENISTLFGKIKKFLADLNPIAFDGIDIPIHYGTTEYWDSQTMLIGEKSHIYVYTDYTTTEYNGNSVFVPNIKIGDGNAYLIDNPFITTSIEDLLQLHIEDNIKHITEQERAIWNNKVSCHLSNDDSETVVFTTN